VDTTVLKCSKGGLFVDENLRIFNPFSGNTIINEVKTMKEGIHPKYEKCTVSCACGNTFESRSTKGNIKVEICAKCHPFYTGKQKLVDSGGRIDKFNKRFNLGK
jgi:large subunit ribosomal protein L31